MRYQVKPRSAFLFVLCSLTILNTPKIGYLSLILPYPRLPRDGIRVSTCNTFGHVQQPWYFFPLSQAFIYFQVPSESISFLPCLCPFIFQFLSSAAINSTTPVKYNSAIQLYLLSKAALRYHQSEMRFYSLLLILEQVILGEKPHRP